MKYDIHIPQDVRVTVFGDVHEHEEQFDKLLEYVQPSDKSIIISVGDVYDKGFGKNVAVSITDKLIDLHNKGYAYAIRGNHELSNIKYAKEMTPQLDWWRSRPLFLPFVFHNHARVTIVHGGVLPRHTWYDLANSVDTCYIRKVDKSGNYVKRIKKERNGMRVMEDEKPGTIWHELYDGRFGYIVSGHNAQKDGVPKFYNYSCNIDTAVYHTGKLTAQTFINGTKEKLLTFEGTPKYLDLNEMYRLMAQGRI